jgi:hypothetical protein
MQAYGRKQIRISKSEILKQIQNTKANVQNRNIGSPRFLSFETGDAPKVGSHANRKDVKI